MKRLPRNKSRHHCKPKSVGGPNTDENISFVSKVQHKAWHSLFSNLNPHKIAKIINDVWIDKGYKLIVTRR